MRAGLTEREKTTTIYFDEFGDLIEVQTHNTDLKKRLTAFSKKYPQSAVRLTMTSKAGWPLRLKKAD